MIEAVANHDQPPMARFNRVIKTIAEDHNQHAAIHTRIESDLLLRKAVPPMEGFVIQVALKDRMEKEDRGIPIQKRLNGMNLLEIVLTQTKIVGRITAAIKDRIQIEVRVLVIRMVALAKGKVIQLTNPVEPNNDLLFIPDEVNHQVIVAVHNGQDQMEVNLVDKKEEGINPFLSFLWSLHGWAYIGNLKLRRAGNRVSFLTKIYLPKVKTCLPLTDCILPGPMVFLFHTNSSFKVLSVIS